MSREGMFAAAIICLAGPAFAETAYFTAIPDLPVAPGLSESDMALASFAEQEGGEIILTAAQGATSPTSVRRFYLESLSALGWAHEPSPNDDSLTFLRGRERLVLSVDAQDGRTYLRARLIVRPASMGGD